MRLYVPENEARLPSLRVSHLLTLHRPFTVLFLSREDAA